jgi:hypothetical protein
MGIILTRARKPPSLKEIGDERIMQRGIFFRSGKEGEDVVED